MFRFSCFNPNHSHKPNKTAQDSIEAMHQTSKDYSQFQSLNEPLDLFSSKKGVSAHSGDKFKHAGHFLKSEDISCKFDSESSNVHQSGVLRKSQSLSRLFSLKCGVRFEDESNGGGTNQQFFCDDSQVHSSLVPGGIKRQEESSSCKYKKVANSESVQVSSDIISDKSSFSIGESHKPEMKGHENFGTLIPGDSAGEFGNITPQAPARMVKSTSMPIMDASLEYHGGSSSEDSQILNTDVQAPVTGEQQREIPISKTENNNYEDYVDDYDDTYNYSGLSKDWIMPVIDEGSAVRDIHDELSFHQRNELESPDFKNKRIKEWIDSIQHSGPLEESSESLYVASDDKKDVNVLHGLIAPKADAKVSLGMEAAKRYISSLSATASTAQLSNFGLVVIPFLGAFASLRVLNLSGNAIVRITAGALPRGLHTLNLSKNKISTIEGLRELARLRVLDLSYNKIIRIGHGLASCSSLKELYLAGNKISEVEGLHRLLKLTVLDLRFNKISTAKCVSQLAANYNSLQAISLEGNPAQKNVGDEQLKKYLQSILPNLAYYNRQTIKGGTLKDAAATERAVRLGMGANQYDRSLRSDHKSTRKSSRSSGSLKPSSSTHARGGRPALSPSKRSKGRRAPVPPPIGTNQRYHLDYHSIKQLDLRPNLLMPRSRSENTLAAF